MNVEYKKGDCRSNTTTIKILLIGNSSVGKTLITQKFLNNEFIDSTVSTIGVDLQNKKMEIDGNLVKFLLWDTAGEERIKTMTFPYYRGCDVILIIFDVTSMDSFNNTKTWLEYTHKFARKNVMLVLVGNKIDKDDERVVNYEQGHSLADENDMKYFEISAEKVINLNEMFEQIAKEYMAVHEPRTESVFDLQINKKKKSSFCVI